MAEGVPQASKFLAPASTCPLLCSALAHCQSGACFHRLRELCSPYPSLSGQRPSLAPPSLVAGHNRYSRSLTPTFVCFPRALCACSLTTSLVVEHPSKLPCVTGWDAQQEAPDLLGLPGLPLLCCRNPMFRLCLYVPPPPPFLWLAAFEDRIADVDATVAWRGLGEADISNEGMYLRRLVVTVKDAWAALFLGVIILLSVFYSVPALLITRRPGSTSTAHLTALNIMIALACVANTAVGTAIWFFTLKQRDNFETVWREAGPRGQQVLQDWMGCCGYWNASAAGLFASPTGLCASSQVAAVRVMRMRLCKLVLTLHLERKLHSRLCDADDGLFGSSILIGCRLNTG